MRRALSQCLAAAAVLALAGVAPAGAHAKAKPAKDAYRADPAFLKQVKQSYAVFREPKAETDVITGLRGVPKAERRSLARAQSRFLADISGVRFYAVVAGRQLAFWSVPVADGYLGAGIRLSVGPFDPLSELRQVVRVPFRWGVPEVVRAALVADGTTNAVHRRPDGTTTPMRVWRNLVAYGSDGSGTIEWTRPDGTIGSIPAADPAAFAPRP